jgi:outer membrane protein assembly factor BamE (lipoprotein component of BamABCDE complex)
MEVFFMMQLKFYNFTKSFLIIIILLLCNCSHNLSTHGYIPKNEIKIGTDKNLLKQIYGTPVFTDDNNWYYVEIKTNIDNLALKKKYSARILKITFDNKDKVKFIETTKINDLNAIKVCKKSDLNDEKFSINKKVLDLLGNLAPSL